MKTSQFILYLFLIGVGVCGNTYAERTDNVVHGNSGSSLIAESYGEFDEPWAMTFLPDGRLLVTEKSGALYLVRLNDRTKLPVRGMPEVAYGGQGGLGDVVLHPNYPDNHWIYLSYAEQGSWRKKGAVVARAELNTEADPPSIVNLEVIWRQTPKVSGAGHYSHRLAFGPEGHLFITSGDRQKLEPAQHWGQNLGKVIRINPDGSIPKDNPFQDQGELAKSFWSLGHRNVLGIAFDKQGQLWTHEMGPRHGDEFNLTVAGENYGWPLVSWGDHYSGFPIPDHDTRPEFKAPAIYWVPTVAPSGLALYYGSMFPNWQGQAFIGGLRSESLLRIRIDGQEASEAERFAMGERIREVEVGPEGALWVLEDGVGGRLLRLACKC
ncbi:PQQ-dependent sugar dehydrogenase [Marinobacter sp. MDS2]|uniref:PQQ-dependent sugar dehydrogenase n=1 Tax=Marinobacter sp. MDS2 TaxID=3065961 RepID=UPI00273AB111|nr:PQQ-dependent sugar dehydrogenase [Marinobacter sp. MDS2]MDP4548821.1 PQQ-dependent sugar dehydrogenase [Marinobacter sp. MDS2]